MEIDRQKKAKNKRQVSLPPSEFVNIKFCQSHGAVLCVNLFSNNSKAYSRQTADCPWKRRERGSRLSA